MLDDDNYGTRYLSVSVSTHVINMQFSYVTHGGFTEISSHVESLEEYLNQKYLVLGHFWFKISKIIQISLNPFKIT